MRTAGIICEYNPFHRGHRFQLQKTRTELGADTGIICLMSGNYVQRGEPAIFDKWSRAAAAVEQGADLVLELPITSAVSGAGYFAQGAVSCLDRLGIVDVLCFGSESGDLEGLQRTAEILCSEHFEESLRQQLKSGISYARAREKALEELGGDGVCLRTANNALGVDYLVSLRHCNSNIQPMTIQRQESHSSATALRERILAGEWPDEVSERLKNQPIHTLEYGERAVLAVLKSRTPAEFQTAPFGSEGLWSKVMKACFRENSLEGILFACKSKRYTMSRLKRMLLCLFLGISRQNIEAPAPYLRALSFNNRGRQLLREIQAVPIVTGDVPQTPEAKAYFELERRTTDLYGLFAPPGIRERSDREKATPPVYLPER